VQCVLVYSSGQDAAVRLCISTGDLQAKVLHESHDRSKLWGGTRAGPRQGGLFAASPFGVGQDGIVAKHVHMLPQTCQRVKEEHHGLHG
jgi:hypothetical protein